MNSARKSYSIPISVKGIAIENGRVYLRKNEREEWELPGGKLEEGEQPTETVTREMREELGLEVETSGLVHAYVYTIKNNLNESKGVLVLSYRCTILKRVGDFEHEGEAGPAEFKTFAIGQIEDLYMPQFYKDAIQEAFATLHL